MSDRYSAMEMQNAYMDYDGEVHHHDSETSDEASDSDLLSTSDEGSAYDGSGSDDEQTLKLDKWLKGKEKSEKKKDGDGKSADLYGIEELLEPLSRFCFESKHKAKSKRIVAAIRKHIKPF